ncbi:MAG: response regulator transcription factor [Gemmatimonadetes bacterium]|nr:response regulator transcription factor [Gemmatimonadota bacterium]
MRLLLVEDDLQLGESLARGLREHAYAVDLAVDGDRGSFLARVNPYDAIVLDVMIPGQDGLQVARALRAGGVHAPILFLTARDAVQDRIAGLDSGGDDYLTKPFDFGELLARLRALIRRRAEVTPDTLSIGDLVVDSRRQTVARGARAIVVTAKEYAVLEYLARHAGRVVSRAEITDHVWDDNHDPMSNSLEVFISRLRRKIDGEGGTPLLHTRRRSGYLLADLADDAPDE